MPSAPPDDSGPHTAPHDEVVSVVRGLVEASGTGMTNLDALANALKARGFRRPPGSPRLVTRLRRIRQIVVSPRGAIKLASDVPEGPPPAEPSPEPLEPVEDTALPGRRCLRRRMAAGGAGAGGAAAAGAGATPRARRPPDRRPADR